MRKLCEAPMSFNGTKFVPNDRVVVLTTSWGTPTVAPGVYMGFVVGKNGYCIPYVRCKVIRYGNSSRVMILRPRLARMWKISDMLKDIDSIHDAISFL